MAISIQPYTVDRIPAVMAFNRRLADGGVGPEFQFPESNIPDWLPKYEGRSIYQEYHLAVDADSVRGAFILKYQDFAVRGQSRKVVYYHLPVSEGIVNKAYAGVGVLMLRTALKMEPTLYALGMGGFDRPLPKMLKAMGWSLCAAPFYFKVQHPSKFLRHIAPLRQSPLRRTVASLAAFSGGGWVGIKTLHSLRSKSPIAHVSAEPVDRFDNRADLIFQSCADQYPLIASRGSGILNILYPAGKNFLKYIVSRGSETIGWFVVLDTQMRRNKYFGDLRIGSIADGLAASENARAVIVAATRILKERGVDLVVCNHSHLAWGQAFRNAGFLQGPSNFIFAASRNLVELVSPFADYQQQIYFMRGDGDGPVNL